MATTFITHVQAGTHAARPGAGTVPQGTLYACSTHGLVYQSDGTSAWSDWFGTGAVSSFGSNVNAVGQANAGGASSSNTRADHVHLGVRTLSHTSNTFAGPVILTASGTLGITSPTPGTFDLTATAGTAAGGSAGVTVQDEGTPLATTGTTLNFVGAGVAATGAGATKTITIAGGSSSDVLPLDVPPGSPHASDDEFPAGSLDAKWTNPITSTRATDATCTNGWVYIEPSAAGASAIATNGPFGIRQAAPAGSFTVMCKMAYPIRGNDIRAGIFVERLTATAKAHMAGIQDSGNNGIDAIGISSPSHSADWGGYDGAFLADTVSVGPTIVTWHKITWDSGTSVLSFFYSNNGVFWTPHTTRSSQSQPEHMGLAIWSNSTSIYSDQQIAFDWFRVTEP